MSRSGYTAWKTVNNDAAGCDQPGIDAIHVHDGAGTRTVDTEMVPGGPPGPSSGLSKLEIIGERVTWLHDGAPRSAALR